MAVFGLVCTKAAKQGAGGICNTISLLRGKNLDNAVRNETTLGTPGQTRALVLHHVDHRPSATAPDASDRAFVIRIKRTWTSQNIVGESYRPLESSSPLPAALFASQYLWKSAWQQPLPADRAPHTAKQGSHAAGRHLSFLPYCRSATVGPSSFFGFSLVGTHVDRLNAPSAASTRMSAPPPGDDTLSYTWGNPFPTTATDESPEDWDSPKQTVVCNGNPLHVRRNLHDALLHLANSSKRGWLRRDLLCIRQDDLTERSNQVALM